MKPIKFNEKNFTFTAPSGMDDCSDLPCWRGFVRGRATIISKWRLTWRERLHALLYGTVWLHVRSSEMPPVGLDVARTVFTTEPAKP